MTKPIRETLGDVGVPWPAALNSELSPGAPQRERHGAGRVPRSSPDLAIGSRVMRYAALSEWRL